MSDTNLLRRLTGQPQLEDSRRRAFVQTSMSAAIIIAVYVAAVTLLFPGIRAGIIVGAMTALSFAAIAFWARRSSSIEWPAKIFLTVCAAAIFFVSAINGGADGYIAPFFIASPVIAGYFLGARAALTFGLVAIGCVVTLAAGDAFGLVIDSPYADDLVQTAASMVLATAIALTMFASISFSRRAAEHSASLGEANALLSAFARTAPIAVAMFDRDIRYIEASDRWLSDYSLLRDDVIGRTHYDVFPEIPQEWKDVHQRCLNGKTERSEADRFERADGTVQWILWEVRPWRNMDGDIGGIIMISRDITDQMQVRESLEAASLQAKEASKAKSAFLATMSHEIRTPLNAVINLTEAVLGTDLDDRQRKLLTEANHSGSHLLSLISDILDLSKLEAGKMELDPIRFSLRGMIAGVAGMFASAAENKGVVLEANVAPGMPNDIIADESRLRQILINLVGNALKFTAFGKIEIIARAEPLHAAGAGRIKLTILVKDTGIGIRADRISTLFDEFAQADASTTRKYGGTGLGLAICRKLIEEMQGSISCESHSGAGSTFRIELPVDAAGAKSKARTASHPADIATALSGLNILFADDNAGNRLVYEEIAKTLSCDFTLVASGREAIIACQENHFDAILMDVEMPEMDGLETLKRIRSLPGRAAATPVIAVTAHALKGDRERILAQGMSGYLSKPVSRKALAETVLSALSGRAGQPSSNAQARHAELVDMTILSDFVGTLGPERAASLFSELWGSLSQMLETLKAAGDDDDCAAVRNLAHSACGLAANLGAAALSQTLRSIEHSARDGVSFDARLKTVGELEAQSRQAIVTIVAAG